MRASLLIEVAPAYSRPRQPLIQPKPNLKEQDR